MTKSDVIVDHAVDGGAPDRVVIREPHRLLGPTQWLADGRIIYVSESDAQGTTSVLPPDVSQIMVVNPGESTGHTIVTGAATSPEVSPNGRWLAFSSIDVRPDRRRHTEVFVQPFPGPGPRIQIDGNGTNAAWSPDGKTLYFVRARDGMFAVDVDGSGVAFHAGTPRQLYAADTSRLPACDPAHCFDISQDGSRFLLSAPVSEGAVARMNLILNWTSTLTK